MKKMLNKRGQVTLFIIIAVVVVAVVVLFLVIRGQMARDGGPGAAAEPKSYIQDCVKQYLKSSEISVGITCDQEYETGTPFCYYGVPYFCYADVLGKPCQPVYPNVIVDESLEEIKGNVNECIDFSLEEIKKKGYEIQRCSEEELEVVFTSTPEFIVLDIKCSITITKEKTMSYENFRVEHPSAGHIVWTGDFSKFEKAVTLVVEMEHEGNPHKFSSEIKDAVEKLGLGYGITLEPGCPGCGITIYTLTQPGLTPFEFAIMEVKN